MLQAEKVSAYHEAQNILALGQKWQRLYPGEKRPNFERSAKNILRRAMGHKTVGRHTHRAMHVHNGLMHQHEPREARRIERYLKSGIVHPGVLHSFRQGARPEAAGHETALEFAIGFLGKIHMGKRPQAIAFQHQERRTCARSTRGVTKGM